MSNGANYGNSGPELASQVIHSLTHSFIQQRGASDGPDAGTQGRAPSFHPLFSLCGKMLSDSDQVMSLRVLGGPVE